MLTQIITFLIFVAVIGCILYGRRLIRTEKVDAVFGNPERALGGTHWIIVGSSFLLLIWLYYSWDIAKGFYPKSANELCQVAKVNDSLLGLKYQFPIEERELKSTAQIKKENKNLKKITIEIEKSRELNNQEKLFFSFIDLNNDKNITYTSKKFQTLVKTMADYVKVGIHPSWASNADTHKLSKEINRLEAIVNREVIRSRQHFLRLDLPTTYRRLIDLGILQDYTMGYASQVGFRAGTSSVSYTHLTLPTKA